MKEFLKYIKKKDIFLSSNNFKFNIDTKSYNILFLLLKIWEKLSDKRRFQLFLLIFLMISSGFLEYLTLASMIPFLDAIGNSETLLKYKIINYFYNTLGYTSQNQLIILTTFCFLFIIYFSAFFRVINLLFN